MTPRMQQIKQAQGALQARKAALQARLKAVNPGAPALQGMDGMLANPLVLVGGLLALGYATGAIRF